jgi:hypothetical protein
MGVRDRGWTHHIQRLMVLGNHALQRGYRPAELTEWFATAYVDGFRWVMPTNVVGISQHADGGKLATKPYAAGGPYINRMSDHAVTARTTRRSESATTPAPSPPATGRSFTATGIGWPRTTAHSGQSGRWSGSRTSTPCSSRSRRAAASET